MSETSLLFSSDIQHLVTHDGYFSLHVPTSFSIPFWRYGSGWAFAKDYVVPTIHDNSRAPIELRNIAGFFSTASLMPTKKPDVSIEACVVLGSSIWLQELSDFFLKASSEFQFLGIVFCFLGDVRELCWSSKRLPLSPRYLIFFL